MRAGEPAALRKTSDGLRLTFSSRRTLLIISEPEVNEGVVGPRGQQHGRSQQQQRVPGDVDQGKARIQAPRGECRSPGQRPPSLTRTTSGSNGAEPMAPATRARTSCESM